MPPPVANNLRIATVAALLLLDATNRLNGGSAAAAATQNPLTRHSFIDLSLSDAPYEVRPDTERGTLERTRFGLNDANAPSAPDVPEFEVAVEGLLHNPVDGGKLKAEADTGRAIPPADYSLAMVRRLADTALPLLAIHDEAQPLPDDLPPLQRPQGPTRLDAYYGKLLLVNFWATWCPPCRHEMPALDALHAELGGDDFAVLAINLDRNGLTRAQEFYAARNIDALEILVDERMAASGRLRVVSLPTSLLIDPGGREIGRIVGIADWNGEGSIEFFRNVIELVNDRAAASADL